MNKVTVLVEGYAYPFRDGCYCASPTCTLVESGDTKFLVDPGTDSTKLLKALDDKGIKKSDIDFIFISHYHPDHWLNVRLFPDLDIYDGEICWDGTQEIFYKGLLPGVKDVEVVSTPGHATEDASLLVKTEDGVMGICPDVFWWEDGKQKSVKIVDLMGLKDPFANNKKLLIQSRKTILEKADYVIPGHGKMFKVLK